MARAKGVSHSQPSRALSETSQDSEVDTMDWEDTKPFTPLSLSILLLLLLAVGAEGVLGVRMVKVFTFTGLHCVRRPSGSFLWWGPTTERFTSGLLRAQEGGGVQTDIGIQPGFPGSWNKMLFDPGKASKLRRVWDMCGTKPHSYVPRRSAHSAWPSCLVHL